MILLQYIDTLLETRHHSHCIPVTSSYNQSSTPATFVQFIPNFNSRTKNYWYDV